MCRRLAAAAGMALAMLAAAPVVRADVAGRVVDAIDGAPVAGAVVTIRARPEFGQTVTDAGGEFVLALSSPELLEIGAALPYDPALPHNYLSSAQQVFDGMSGLQIQLLRLPATDNPGYQPPLPENSCRSCHGTYYNHWRQSRHAGSAVNPWVLDLFSGTGTPGGGAGYVFRDLHDPDDTGFCATCHAPLEDVFDPGAVMLDELTTPIGLDGVTCLACHQLAHVNDDVDALHHLGNGEYRFPLSSVDTWFYVWGNLPDVPTTPMQASYSPLHGQSKFCASCHQYSNPSTGAPGQNTYREWLASPYAQPGPDQRQCQDCHMPRQSSAAVIGSGGPVRPGSQRRAHAMIGATPDSLSANIDLRVQAVQQGAQLVITAEVENHCGHNFPTGISIRNALLVVEVRHADVELAQTSGSVLPFWASDDVPGQQPGDYAGRPGKGYAKVLEGRINGQGEIVRPVLFIDADGVHSDTGIPSGQTDSSQYRFALPVGLPAGSVVEVDVRLLYRRAWRALAVTKGWTQAPGGMPVEIQVHRRQLSIASETVADQLFTDGFEPPVMALRSSRATTIVRADRGADSTSGI